jgi:hypothetical protein
MTKHEESHRGHGVSDEKQTATGDEDEAETEEDSSAERADRTHLDGVADGCGCAEVWEHLSEQRNSAESASQAHGE